MGRPRVRDFPRVGDVSEILLARCARTFNFWYKQWNMFSLRLTQTDSLSIYEMKIIYNDPISIVKTTKGKTHGSYIQIRQS